LKEIDQPPPVLYLRGSITAKDCWAVAVVGTRRVSAYGRQVAEELASSSGANGVTVVSGLARGVDAIAHQSALKAGGRTIAVVVEAGGTSGALIPAQFALNQGREVFSVPGNILAPQSKGTNKLIAQGAHPMHSVRDLMNVLNLTRVTEHHLMRKVLPKDETELMLMGVLTR
jgi:DNA processing protein